MVQIVTHVFVSGIADDPAAVAAGKIVPSNWNANHVITGPATGLIDYATFTSTGNTVGTEQVIEITSGTFTLTLTNPTVLAGQAWRTLFKNSGSGSCTLSGTIDSGSSWTLGAGASVTLIFNGTGWLVF